MRKYLTGLALAAVGLMSMGLPNPARGQAAGFGDVTGQVIFDGNPPAVKQLQVDKDQGHCLAKGPLTDEAWVVNPANKGVRNVVVFIKPEKGETLPTNPALKVPAEVVLDQPQCYFSPRTLTMMESQKLVAKNPAPVPHNIVIKGFNNDYNRQIPPGKEEVLQLQAEKNAVSMSCGAHPWMKGWLWVFNHPYHAVTDADGKFTIKGVPAGPRNVVIWHEERGWVNTKDGQKVDVKAGGATDLGQIKVK